jgi:two-component system, NtrC family, response regulator GlrR
MKCIGTSPAFLQALKLIKRFAVCDTAVLILGETGTGKELAARSIHYHSARHDQPFVPVNCGALPDSLVESEFFGHVGGAFTDAREARAGLVAHAKHGTLFLDELEALSLRAQAVLLRFLQDHEYRPVGGTRSYQAHVRIVGSSNADLRTLVRKNLFRDDLLFRLNGLTVELPPLRTRGTDVVLLAREFVHRLNQQNGTEPNDLSPNVLLVLQGYDWPGNVRELQNVIQQAYLLAEGPTITEVNGIPSQCREEEAANAGASLYPPFTMAKAHAIATFEVTYLMALLQHTRGNLSKAADICGKDRSDLSRLLKKHQLERTQFTHAPSVSSRDPIQPG